MVIRGGHQLVIGVAKFVEFVEIVPQHFRNSRTSMSRVVPEPITMGTRTKASEHERVTWTSGCTKVSWGSIRMIVPDVELDCGKGVIVRYTDIGPRRAEPVFLFHG